MAHVNPIQVQKFLKGVDYPASKAALLEKAKSMGADENVCASIEQLPDEEFQTPADVSQAFGRLPDEVSGSEGARKEEPRGKAEARGHKEEERAAGAPAAHKAEDRGHKEAHAAPRGERKEEARPEEHARKEPAHRSERSHPHYTGSEEFLVQAMQDSMAEIRICEIAIEKSGNADVKAFAQSMIDEHSRMGRELEQLAADRHLDAPRQVRPEQKMTVDELSSLDGTIFEQRWIQYNIDVHERDIKVFRHYAEAEEDRDIRDLAKKQADALGHHLKKAHDVGKKLAKA
jgi:predicted outer membrane protein